MKRVQPRPGQESVWDYPRPPKLELSRRHVQVVFAGEVIADSERAYRVLETSHPPSWYIPPADLRKEHLVRTGKGSLCEWKGEASYWSVMVRDSILEDAGWSYQEPSAAFALIKGYLSFYPHLLECYVDDERVVPQAGGFYGGWVTSDIVGPFKGVPGSWGW